VERWLVMKLVVSFSSGDGCTYNCDVDIPVEWESPESLIVALENHCNIWLGSGRSVREAWKARPINREEFKAWYPGWSERDLFHRNNEVLPGTKLCASDFILHDAFCVPDDLRIVTLEEWWEAGVK
jgi:hypothetical protein